MALHLPGAPQPAMARPNSYGPGRSRKIAILGAERTTLAYAPWTDPSWTFWAQASAYHVMPEGRADVLIDTHPRPCFEETRKNGFANYYQFLQLLRTPIYMQEAFPDIPASRRYPMELVKQQFPYHLGSQTAALIALALLEGATHIGIWGAEYKHESEYSSQRPHTLLWVGIAIGMGVQIVTAPNSTLLVNPDGDYGWDSHATPELIAARKEQFATYAGSPMAGQVPKPTKALLTPDDFAEAARKRATADPGWAKAMSQCEDGDIPQDILEQEARERAAAGLG